MVRDRFNESVQPDLGAQDIRITSKGKMIYAFVQGWPREEVRIAALGLSASQIRIADVRLLGRNEALKFIQTDSEIRVTLPQDKPQTAETGIALRLNFA